MTLSFAERRDWLRLARTPNIGPVAFWKLIGRFGSPANALANLHDLKRKFTPPPLEAAEQEMDASDQAGVRIICADEADFPALLRVLDPAPPIISVWGHLALTERPCVAIVGSRNASAIGQKFARQIAGELGEAGVTIVSGLARGIDAAAHNGSLDSGTVGVLGGGVDHIYPRQNTDLHFAMREQGLLVSESPLGYRATARDFPRRNRLISGLSRAVIVIEAAERSGTLITARYALEQNREVMAAPGSPLDPRTKGCNRLIRDGATLIETSDDILAVLENLPALDPVPPKTAPAHKNKPQSKMKLPPVMTKSAAPIIEAQPEPVRKTDPAARLLEQISFTPTARDDVIRGSGLPTADATAALMELQLMGRILVDQDGRVSRNT